MPDTTSPTNTPTGVPTPDPTPVIPDPVNKVEPPVQSTPTTPAVILYMVIGFAISLACVYFLELSALVAASYRKGVAIDPAILEGWKTTGAGFVSFVFGVLVNTKLSK